MAYLVIAIMLSLQILVCSSLSNFEFRAFAGGKSGGGGDGWKEYSEEDDHPGRE